MEKEIVIFRKFRDGEIIALFPEMEGAKIGLVGSYMHVGQHGDADYFWVIDSTKPAKPHECTKLKQELGSIGYNLRVVKKGAYHLWWR